MAGPRRPGAVVPPLPRCAARPRPDRPQPAARKPGIPLDRATSAAAQRSRRRAVDTEPHPHYTEIPRWGLHDHVDAPSTRRDWPELLAGKAARFLTITTGLYAFGVLAELGRYAVLLRNRTRLIDPTVLAVSDLAVFVGQAGGMLFALLSGIAGVCWLLRMRRRTFAQAKKSDPRTPTDVVVGCAVPA